MSAVNRKISPAHCGLSLILLLAPAALNAQTSPTTASSTTIATTSTQSDYGTLLSLNLEASKLTRVQLAPDPSFSLTATGQCPALGKPRFTYDISFQSIPVGDTSAFYDGTHSSPVLGITHLRVITTLSYNGNTVTQRQDWTRIKENDNGIDNVTGIRHYIGNFQEETMTPSGSTAVITGETQGVMTLREPLSFTTGPLASVATRVDAVQFIGPQAAWLEPFPVSDSRLCRFLQTGVPQPVDPYWSDHCVVNSSNTYHYNGVTFHGNIVGCSQTQWP